MTEKTSEEKLGPLADDSLDPPVRRPAFIFRKQFSDSHILFSPVSLQDMFRMLNRTKPLVDGLLTLPFTLIFQPLNVAAINVRVGTPIGKMTGRSCVKMTNFDCAITFLTRVPVTFLHYRTMLEIIANPYDGWRALWKGTTPALLTVILGSLIRSWNGNAIAKEIVRVGETGDEKEMAAALRWSEISPDIAKVVTSLAVQPLNVIQTRLAVDFSSQHRNFKGFFDCIRKTRRSDGMATFWRGLLPAFYGYVFGAVASGVFITGAASALEPSRPGPQALNQILPLFVPLSFAVSSAIMHPFLIVASQRQVSSIFLPNHMRPKMLGKLDPQGFGSTWQILKTNVARYGVRRGLFRGFGVTLAHSILTQPILWLTAWRQPGMPTDQLPGLAPPAT
jgi:hypothetical protein